MWVALGCLAIVAIAGLAAFLSRCPVLVVLKPERETHELRPREVHIVEQHVPYPVIQATTHVVYVHGVPEPASAMPAVPVQHVVQAPERGQLPTTQRSASPRGEAPQSRPRVARWQR